METSKKWFWILLDILIATVVIVVLCSLSAVGSWGSAMVPARTITVTAQGKTTATPDLAELTFSVVTQGADPTALSNNNNTKMNAVLQFVSGQGIASSDVKTTSYDLEPNYSNVVVPVNFPNIPGTSYTTKPPTITGYTLTQTVEVKVHDLTKVAAIMGGLAPLGVNQIGGVTFTFNDPDAVTAVARANAIQMAQTKAAAMAQEAGTSLGEVVNINESSYLPGPIAYASAGGAMDSVAAVAPTINPGTQDITDNVTITYALR